MKAIKPFMTNSLRFSRFFFMKKARGRGKDYGKKIGRTTDNPRTKRVNDVVAGIKLLKKELSKENNNF